MPSIIEAWFISSETITQPGMRDPSVDSDAQFDM